MNNAKAPGGHRGPLAIVGLFAVVLTLGLAACGGSDDSSDSSGNETAVKDPTALKFSDFADKGGVEGAKQYLEKVQDESKIDFDSFIPAESPPAAEDKSIAVILNGTDAQGAVRAAEGMESAGEALGWDVDVTDGQFDPNVQSQAVLSAVTSKADGIVLNSISPVTVGGAVAKAISSGIPVVTTFDPGSSETTEGVFGDASNGTFDGGLALGAWIAVASDGKGRVVNVPDTSLGLTQQRADGVEVGLKEFCPDCEILATQENDIANMASRLPSLTSSSIQKYGTDDLYMVAPFDAAATFMIQGAKDAKAPYFPIVSMDGNQEALAAIAKKDYLAATWAAAAEWMGWEALDQMNRAFNEEPPVEGTVPSLLVDESNLPPTGDDWAPDYDYESKYKELWGLE
ncbi:MAG: substrate-binding domain-containing protein [Actinomycetota bacterium]|nr:substrate-binding domain-containing protein [Actinomycetota bacterium]